ncbi:MAG: CHAT domain-containing protein [Bacteroidota bacterium]
MSAQAESSAKPIAFLAFANAPNGSEKFLEYLQEEEEFISNHLYDSEYIRPFRRKNIKPLQILRQFRGFSEEMLIFHFSGHARGTELGVWNYKGDYTSADFKYIAKEMQERCQQVKLVFLNGCSTDKQIQHFLDHTNALVIATTRPVKDALAAQFAVHFYEGLSTGSTAREAFDDAKATIAKTFSKEVRYKAGNRSYRDIISTGKFADLEGELPYLLVSSDPLAEKAGLKDWTRTWKKFHTIQNTASAQEGKKEEETAGQAVNTANHFKVIPSGAYLDCNRITESKKFKSLYRAQVDKKRGLDVCFIVGQEKHRPTSLVDRFIKVDLKEYFLLAYANRIPATKHVIINFPEKAYLKDDLDESPDKTRIDFKNSLSQIQSAIAISEGRQMSGEELASGNLDLLCVEHVIPEGQWHAYTGELIQTYIKEFWEKVPSIPDAPPIMLFFTVVCQNKKESVFKGLGWGKKRSLHEKAIGNLLKKISSIHLIDTLHKIDADAILAWFTKYMRNEMGLKSRYFEEEEPLPMGQVEDWLKDVISDYKKKKAA